MVPSHIPEKGWDRRDARRRHGETRCAKASEKGRADLRSDRKQALPRDPVVPNLRYGTWTRQWHPGPQSHLNFGTAGFLGYG